MKFSIVTTDKQQTTHLSVKTAAWFFERILTDTKAETIGKLRQSIATIGDTGD
jgi:ribosomal protein L17